jgi:hypothetical protein
MSKRLKENSLKSKSRQLNFSAKKRRQLRQQKT